MRAATSVGSDDSSAEMRFVVPQQPSRGGNMRRLLVAWVAVGVGCTAPVGGSGTGGGTAGSGGGTAGSGGGTAGSGGGTAGSGGGTAGTGGGTAGSGGGT